MLPFQFFLQESSIWTHSCCFHKICTSIPSPMHSHLSMPRSFWTPKLLSDSQMYHPCSSKNENLCECLWWWWVPASAWNGNLSEKGGSVSLQKEADKIEEDLVFCPALEFTVLVHHHFNSKQSNLEQLLLDQGWPRFITDIWFPDKFFPPNYNHKQNHLSTAMWWQKTHSIYYCCGFWFDG